MDICTVTHNSKYLGVPLDRTPSYKKYLSNIAAKINSWNNIKHELTSTTDFSALRTFTIAFEYSTAEYYDPVWINSTHTKNVYTLYIQSAPRRSEKYNNLCSIQYIYIYLFIFILKLENIIFFVAKSKIFHFMNLFLKKIWY